MQQLFLNFPQIDYHDHIRQGSLRIEGAIGKGYWRRLFSTIVSMTLVDTYFAYLWDWATHHHGSFEGAMDPVPSDHTAYVSRNVGKLIE